MIEEIDSKIDGRLSKHCTIVRASGEMDGMKLLKDLFPEAEADEFNFCLFSTSGVHGTYQTIEDEEAQIEEIKSGDLDQERLDDMSSGITFLVVHPRLVAMAYGLVHPITKADFKFLKKLRKSSLDVLVDLSYCES